MADGPRQLTAQAAVAGKVRPVINGPLVGEVTAPDGAVVRMTSGQRLTFGRGTGVDLHIGGDPQLSREAGRIIAVESGLLIFNHSRTHAIYVDGDDFRIRLPRMTGAQPAGGWMLAQGRLLIGSLSMLRERHGISVHAGLPAAGQSEPACRTRHEQAEPTVRPLDLAPDTKLFLVALVLCRPWLLDPSRATPLPTTPEIARSVLMLTDAWHQLGRFDRDCTFRHHLTEQVADHLKYLRKKLLVHGIVPGEIRLSRALVAESLLANDIVTVADLLLPETPDWKTKQEDLWWEKSNEP